MADFVLVIAVEKYLNSDIPAVMFAEGDAKSFAEALQNNRFVVQNVLLSNTATKATMESQIRRGLARATSEDRFFLYYAGHGAAVAGKNYITCYDTDIYDLEHTSIDLQWILRQIDSSNSQKCAVFLDSCHSGITQIAQARSIYTHMSELEIEQFFRNAQHRVCFAACRVDEQSHSNHILKHGIWTYHLLEALNGDAVEALQSGRYLTASSLQNYVAQAVPRTLRQTFSPVVPQTPILYGSQSSDFAIADLKPLLEKKNALDPSYASAKDVLLRIVDQVRVRSLSGFERKRHKEPEHVSSTTRSWITSISARNIDDIIEQRFRKIKELMRYTRRDVSSESGKIITPDFEFTAYCEQDEDDPATANIVEEVNRINPAIVEDERFNQVFRSSFRELVFEFGEAIDVEKVIDHIEDSEVEGLSVEYPSDNSYCLIRFSGLRFSIRVSRSDVLLTAATKSSPKELLDSFLEARKQIAGAALQKLLPLG